MKKKKEFSKKIFYIVISIFIIVIVYSMALMWKTENSDGLSYLIPSVSGLAATSVGFYYNKAKTENRIKLSQQYNLPIDEVTEIENEVQNESEE